VTRRALVAAACALAATGCHHAVVHKPGEEWLSEIKVVGNHSIGDDVIVDGLGLHRALVGGRAIDPYQLSLDADRIRGLYLRRGFFDVDVRTHVKREGGAQTAIFTIDEGVRAGTKVDITGLPDGDTRLRDAVRKTLPLADGAPFDYDAYDNAKRRFADAVQNAGYAHARVDAHVVADRAQHLAVVTLDYDLGPLCTFGDIQINGASQELLDAATARLEIEKGAKYSTGAIEASRSGLYQMGRFSSVRFEPQLGDDKSTVIPVKISVAEGARHTTQLGGGAGIDPLSYEVRGRAGYSVAGWPTPLTTTAIDLRPAYALLRDQDHYEPRARALLSMNRMDLFAPYITGTAELGVDYLVVEAYSLFGPRARLGLSTPLGSPKIQARVGWQLQVVEFQDINPLVDPFTIHRIGLDQTQRSGKYEAAITIDLRDHPIEPRLGLFAEVKAAVGTEFAGGSLDFFEIEPELRGYVPIGPFTIAARARYGGIFGDVPVVERFYAGGASSNRGFSERRLSPSETGYLDGNLISIPIGGAGLIDSSVELRLPLGTLYGVAIGGVTFLDGADVTDSATAIDPLNLHWSAGVGLRIATAIGPVRFDVGRRLDRTGSGEPEIGELWAFHLSLGEAF
jgi:outer membrane protein assembly factor BamA